VIKDSWWNKRFPGLDSYLISRLPGLSISSKTGKVVGYSTEWLKKSVITLPLFNGLSKIQDIANLYAAFYKQQPFAQDPSFLEQVILHRRYIDNIFYMVLADDLDNVKHVLRLPFPSQTRQNTNTTQPLDCRHCPVHVVVAQPQHILIANK
jgi:hypothetical protein